MKKTILILAMIVAVGFTFTSCKNDKKEEVKEEAAKEIASNDEVYQCPMDCEHGKSYTEAGSCPVCKMDLKAKKAGEASDDVCAKCGKSKEECAKKHGDKGCEKCDKSKEECAKECAKEHGDKKCDKSKEECAKEHGDKVCKKCGKDKECTCPKDGVKKDSTNHDEH